MSEETPTYRFSFFRPRESWRDAWVECPSFEGRINFRLGSEYGNAMLARLMVEAGLPDGDIVATEVRAKAPLVQYFESLHRLAAHKHESSPIALTLAMHTSLVKLIASKTAWATITNKNDLLVRGYVVADEKSVSVTEEGLAAKKAYDATMERQTPNVVLTPHQREAFHVIVNSPEKWKDLHGKTQNLMVNSGWVEMNGSKPSLTNLGQDIFKYVVNSAPSEIQYGAPSEAIIKALTSVRDKPMSWGGLGPRTKGALKDRGYVTVESKTSATITDAGRKAIADFVPV